MELSREYLEKSQGNLKKQYEELVKESKQIPNEKLQVIGALLWIRQTLELLDSKS